MVFTPLTANGCLEVAVDIKKRFPIRGILKTLTCIYGATRKSIANQSDVNRISIGYQSDITYANQYR
jgi:hypothetical protein